MAMSTPKASSSSTDGAAQLIKKPHYIPASFAAAWGFRRDPSRRKRRWRTHCLIVANGKVVDTPIESVFCEAGTIETANDSTLIRYRDLGERPNMTMSQAESARQKTRQLIEDENNKIDNAGFFDDLQSLPNDDAMRGRKGLRDRCVIAMLHSLQRHPETALARNRSCQGVTSQFETMFASLTPLTRSIDPIAIEAFTQCPWVLHDFGAQIVPLSDYLIIPDGHVSLFIPISPSRLLEMKVARRFTTFRYPLVYYCSYAERHRDGALNRYRNLIARFATRQVISPLQPVLSDIAKRRQVLTERIAGSSHDVLNQILLSMPRTRIPPVARHSPGSELAA